MHCKDKIVPSDGLIYLAGAAKAVRRCSTDFRMCWQSEHNLSRDPGCALQFLPCSQADVPRQYHCICYLSTAKWSWHKHQTELQPQPHEVAQKYLCPLVYEGSIISPLTHSDAHSIKVCNFTSAAKASIQKLGSADLYDAWALEMEITCWSSEQPQVLNAALLLYKP